MRIFITGGTGLVGTRLVGRLRERGDQPVVLSRRAEAARQRFGSGVEVVEGDPTRSGPWMQAIDRSDAVVNLAGENLFGRRWTAAYKQLLVDSRIMTTRHVAEAMRRQPRNAAGQPKVLVSGSAIGYYGPHGDEEISESAAAGSDFLAQLCVEWEAAAREVERDGIRCVLLRTGIVLDRQGGALAELLTPFKLFVGGPVGSGRQYMAWIHHEDLVGLILLALDDARCTGPLNSTAPLPVTNTEFSRALGKALGRPSLVWTPGFALRLLLGEAAGIITSGQRVVPTRALALGYTFRNPTIDAALARIFA